MSNIGESNIILCRLLSNVVNGSTVLLSIMHGKVFSEYPVMLGHSSIHLIAGGEFRKNLKKKIIHFSYHRYLVYLILFYHFFELILRNTIK